jgi:mRNA interferase ChpB
MAQSASGWARVVKRGDIYLTSLDPAFGHEQKGTRPVLVVSPDRFNAITQAPIVVPITTGGNFARVAGFTVSLTDAGTRTTGVIRCDQPRPVDLGARNARKLESVPAAIMNEVLALLIPLFE